MDSTGRELFNPEGIPTMAALEFLLQGVRPNRINVCYASGYDINKILHQVPKIKLKELWDSQEYTDWGKYRMRYRKAKNFWLGDARGSLTLWDVFSFFQSSFVKALDKYFPNEKDHEELVAIRAMKARRSQFTLEEIDSIRYYCALELKWLVKLMDKLREHFRQVNLKLSRWDGAGAVASCLLKREKIKQYQDQRIDSILRSLRAYYGGRIETTCIGTAKGPLYQYDLRSAYPSVIRYLPSLFKGTWRQLDKPALTSHYSLHRVRWNFEEGNPFYPLPYRAYNDSILFPPRGAGWYWGIEVSAALSYAELFGGSISLLESWSFIPHREYQSLHPFAFVENIYDERAELKRANEGAEMVLKLALNSLYGKFQQQLGGTTSRFPTYFQPEWSGYITAATRAKLLRAALQKPNSVLMFATDGLFCKSKLQLELGDKLGQWERKELDGLTIVQPGVYYVTEHGEKEEIKSRGFGTKPLEDKSLIYDAWRDGKKSVAIPTTRFLTLGSALASEELWHEWGQWRTVKRELCLDGYNAKRYPVPQEFIPEAIHSLLFTEPRESRDYQYLQEDSKPFATIWNQDELDEELIDGVPYNVWLHETAIEESIG